jgi:hypothetical protein
VSTVTVLPGPTEIVPPGPTGVLSAAVEAICRTDWVRALVVLPVAWATARA